MAAAESGFTKTFWPNADFCYGLLSAEIEINLKVTAKLFEGTLHAWAQKCVRVRVPPGFATPIQAVVSRRENFVCRTDFASNVKQKRQGELYIFTYATNDAASSSAVHLRSEDSTVVIDGFGANR